MNATHCHELTPAEDYAGKVAFYRGVFEAGSQHTPWILPDLGNDGGHNASFWKAVFACTLDDVEPAMPAPGQKRIVVIHGCFVTILLATNKRTDKDLQEAQIRLREPLCSVVPFHLTTTFMRLPGSTRECSKLFKTEYSINATRICLLRSVAVAQSWKGGNTCQNHHAPID